MAKKTFKVQIDLLPSTADGNLISHWRMVKAASPAHALSLVTSESFLFAEFGPRGLTNLADVSLAPAGTP